MQCVSQHEAKRLFFFGVRVGSFGFKLEKSVGILYRAAGNSAYYDRVRI